MPNYTLVEGRGVPLLDPESGKATYFPEDQARALIGQGWQPTTTQVAGEQWGQELDQQMNDDPLAAGVAGFSRGATLGLSDVIGRALAGDTYAKEMSKLAEANPVASLAGELAGGAAGAFIPGGPVAQVGKLGMAAGKGARAAFGAGKAGGLAELIVRGAAEGVGYGAGTAASELALSEKPLTSENLADTLTRHIGGGAAFGAGLSLGVGGLAAAGKFALEKTGLSRGGRELLARQAELTREAEAIAENKAAAVADLKTQLYPPEAYDGLKMQLAKAEAAVDQMTRRGFEASERSQYSLAREAVSKLEAHDDALKAAVLERQTIRDQLKQLKAQSATGPAPKEMPANPELSSALENARSFRAANKLEDVPTLPERFDDVVAALRKTDTPPEVIEAALAKPDFRGKVSSLFKERELPDGRVVGFGKVGGMTTDDVIGRVSSMERALGLPSYGAAADKLAGIEYAVLTGGSKAAKAAGEGAVWDWGTALRHAETRKLGQDAGLKAAFQADLKKAAEELKASYLQADAKVESLRTAGLKLNAEFGLKVSDLPKYREAMRQLEAESGMATDLDGLRRTIGQQDELKARLKELAGETSAEAAIRTELEGVGEQLTGGKAGLLGKVANRAARWQGARSLAGLMGGGAGRFDPIRGAVAQEVANALAPRLVRGLQALVSPGAVSGAASAFGGAGEAIVGAGKRIGKVAGPGVKQAAVRALGEKDFDAIRDELAQPTGAYEMTARAALAHQPEELVQAVVSSHVRQRTFLASKLPQDPRGSGVPAGMPAIPTAGAKWRPSFAEMQRFGRYVRAATHWKNVVEDLVDKRATPEHIEALRAVYPEVAQALQTYVANGVRETTARGGHYAPDEARMIDLVLGPPYQLLDNARFFQATYAPQKRVEPSRGVGPAATTLSKNLMNQLQTAQQGLVR